MDNEPHVKVTLDTIFEKVLETHSGVQTLDTKVDGIAKDSEDHETRLRGLEKKVWAIAAVATVGGASLTETASALGITG